MRLDAFIFDMDGVIIDTVEYHYLSWQRLAKEEGLQFSRETNDQLRGLTRLASMKVILEANRRDANPEQIDEWMERKNLYYSESMEKITPDNILPGVLNLIEEIKAAGMKVAIGSGSKNVTPILQRLGISHLIDAVADGYIAERSKPAPDLFLHAAELLGVQTECCTVIEDSEAGIEAALAAGMWVVGLGPEQRVAKAHARYSNLDGIDLSHILQDLEQAASVLG